MYLEHLGGTSVRWLALRMFRISPLPLFSRIETAIRSAGSCRGPWLYRFLLLEKATNQNPTAVVETPRAFARLASLSEHG